ncbi:MAG: hypothetical protein ACLQGP_20025 [Isosphaeraceae bacterium]
MRAGPAGPGFFTPNIGYDRTIARQVLDGIAGRALAQRIGLADWGSMYRDDSIFVAAAIVDPLRVAAMIESLPETAGSASARSQKDEARLAVARILARQGDDRWHAVEWYLLNLWRIDSEDY